MKYGKVIYDPDEANSLIRHLVIGSNAYRKILEYPETCKGPYTLIEVDRDGLFPFRCLNENKEKVKGYFIREVIEEE